MNNLKFEFLLYLTLVTLKTHYLEIHQIGSDIINSSINGFDCYNVKTKVYSKQDIEFIYYKKAIMTNIPEDKRARGKPNTERGKANDKEESIRTSQVRTIQKIYDYARSNEWEYFITLTFNPKLVNRYDYAECTKKLSKWIKNLKQRYANDLKYIVIPELHKDGAFHFHGLFTDIGNIKMIDSGRKTKGNDIIYNIDNYKLGFSTATVIKDTQRVSSYVCKYITKELCASTLNKKRYWTSHNLRIPDVDKRLKTIEDMKLEMDHIENMAHSKKECAVNQTGNLITYYNVSLNNNNINTKES